MEVYISMTWEDLKAYLEKTSDADDARIEAAWDMAGELLTLATANAFRTMSQEVFDECRLKVGKNWYDSRNTTAGNAQFTTFEGPIAARGPRDPLSEVRPILAMYVVRY